jgi:hypothetical protein
MSSILNTGVRVSRAPEKWVEACAQSECTLHQLSPYIGKIKSSIAGELLERYSRRGELVVDPFAGAGTIPLEAVIRGRRVFCSDISPYSRILSCAKLRPPKSLKSAIRASERAIIEAEMLPKPDLRKIPEWVRTFFHPRSLVDALRFAEIARRPGNEFLMACFLGILHHQRPGFLSYPSSHLIPYLRGSKYPRVDFPEMYSYRELRPRLLAKVERSFKRFVMPKTRGNKFRQCDVEGVTFPRFFDSVITSPPYMNALDYGRDNRLRLWFIEPTVNQPIDTQATRRRDAFVAATVSLAKKVEAGLRPRGYCVLVVGDTVRRSFDAHPSQTVREIVGQHARSLRLRTIISDKIPDVRRSRRTCQGVKTEHFLIFQRN